MHALHAPAFAASHERRRLARGALALAAGALLLSVLCAVPALAAPRANISDPDATPSWWSGVAGSGVGADNATGVLLTKGDATFVCGALHNTDGNADISLTKYLGDVKQWTRLWNGPSRLYDTAEGLALSADGKWVFVAGTTVKSDGTTDIVILKRSASTGALKWARIYDGPNHKIDMPEAVGVDGSGNVVVAGLSDDDGNIDALVASWTSKGKRRWTWRYDGSGHGFDSARGLLVESSGTSYVTGIAVVSGPTQAALTARISPAGKKVWAKTYKGPDDTGAIATSLTRRPGGGVYVCGAVRRTAGDTDGMVLGYAPAGSRTTFAFDGGPGVTSQFFNAVVVTSSKAVVAVGRSESGAVTDCRATVFRPDGSRVIIYTFGTAWSDEFRAVATDQFGGFYATGTAHAAAGQVQVLTWRSTVVPGGGGWQSRWQATPATANVPSAIAVRGTSACVVGSYASGGATGTDQLVLMYQY